MKVTIRTKTLKDGITMSIYLDYYPPIVHPKTGKLTRREFLETRLFVSAKTSAERSHNKQTMALAEQLRAERQIDVQAGKFGFLPNTRDLTDLFIFMDSEILKKKGRTQKSWYSMLNHLRRFVSAPELICSDITPKLCEDFRDCLLSTDSLCKNTAIMYFSKFKSILSKARKNKLLTDGFELDLEPLRLDETNRNYLSIEELRMLKNTECQEPVIKSAALFSALTGLRHVDILKMVWSEVGYSQAEGHLLTYKQRKTGTGEILPLTDQARELLGERRGESDLVFLGLEYSPSFNYKLKSWAFQAGIKKDVTFHCFRHTFATLQLTMGTDIYTVSKLLGHKDLKSTQIYAKIIDAVKRTAVDKIKI